MNGSVYIVGGGNSLSDFNFSKLRSKDVIAVNHSLYSVPWCKHFITMDYTFLKKTDMTEFRRINCNKVFVVNLSTNYLKEINGLYVDTRNGIGYDLKDFDLIIKSRKSEGIGLNFNEFYNGINSAFCAFQYAVILGYQEINLLGFDFICRDKSHFHNGYPQNLQHFQQKLNKYFDYFVFGLRELSLMRPNLKIYNCSKISKLTKHLLFKEI